MGKKREKGLVREVISDTGYVERVPDTSTGRYAYAIYGHKPRGRPTEIDWQGVHRHLIALAYHGLLPDKQSEIMLRPPIED